MELDFGTSSGLANAGSIVYPLVNGVNIEDAQTSFGATVLNVDSVHRSYYLVDVQVVDFGVGTGVAGMATGTFGNPAPQALLGLVWCYCSPEESWLIAVERQKGVAGLRNRSGHERDGSSVDGVVEAVCRHHQSVSDQYQTLSRRRCPR